MSPDVDVRKFCEVHAVAQRTAGAALPFKIPFLDDAIAAAVKALTAADVALDTIIEWVPEIAMLVVNSSLSVKEIVENILAKIKAAQG